MRLTLHSDPGHAWLQIPKVVLRQLNIDQSISSSSYQKHGFAYLEQDSDAPKAIAALDAANRAYEIVEQNSDDYSRIRDYDLYCA